MKLQNNHKARLFLFVLFKIALATVACGKTIYVDDDSAGANNGTSWTDAYVFLQDALADANDSDKPVEIRVAQGIYTPDRGAGQTPGDREATFQLINGVSLTGGYTGVDANDPNARDIELYETILSGDLNGNDAAVDDLQTLYYETTRYDNSYSVVTAEYTDETAVLDGVTITAGMANIDTLSSVNQQYGGGFYCYEARPVIANCTFELNVARRGAGIYNYGGEPSLINCRFVNNVSICDPPERGRGCYGSGLYNIYGKPVLTNCEFIENYGDYGAGISIHRSDNVTMTNCLFKQNRVSSKGGGMHCEDNNNLSIINCRFIENYNSGRYDSGDGGAIYIITGDYLLIDCKFENNHTNYTGGGISNSDAYVFIKNCLFAENSAGNTGGAINFRESTAEIHNCTISNNSAHAGGGLYFGYEEQTVASNVKISNSILWGNRGQIYNGNHSEITITYSCIQDFIIGRAGAKMGIINHEPIFAEPGYWADINDPNVPVNPNDPNVVWVDGDYHLKSEYGRYDPNTESWVIDDVTSPCIDAGDPNTPVGDEHFPNGGRINMGAYGGTSEASMSDSQPEPSPLIAHWKLDETDGDIAYDSAGNHDADVHGGTWTYGIIDGALDFDGFNDYIDCGDSEQLRPEQMTLALWLEPRHMGGMRYIVSRANPSTQNIDYTVMRHIAGEIELSVAQSGTNPLSIMSQPSTALNEWSHVAVCLDGSQACIYINGQLDNATNYIAAELGQGQNLIFSSYQANTRYYHGKMDDIRIYNQALISDDIAALVQQN